MPRRKPAKKNDANPLIDSDEGGASTAPPPAPLEDTYRTIEDIDGILGDTPAPRKKEKAALAEPGAEPEKKLTAEEKKKAAEAEKKEKSRLAFIKAHPTVTKGVGLIAKGAFGVGAVIAKEKLWNLTDEEAEAIGKAWEPVLAIYGPEWLLKIMPVLSAVVVTGQVVAAKASAVADKKEAEKDAKHQKVKAEAEQVTADLEAAAARMKQEREALENAMQRKDGQGEAPGSGAALSTKEA